MAQSDVELTRRLYQAYGKPEALDLIHPDIAWRLASDVTTRHGHDGVIASITISSGGATAFSCGLRGTATARRPSERRDLAAVSMPQLRHATHSRIDSCVDTNQTAVRYWVSRKAIVTLDPGDVGFRLATEQQSGEAPRRARPGRAARVRPVGERGLVMSTSSRNSRPIRGRLVRVGPS